MVKSKEKTNLTESLEKLNAIVEWFDEQRDVDVEAGLKKVREAAALIKGSKSRLAEIENEFKEIEKEIGEEVVKEEKETSAPQQVTEDEGEINVKNIPF